MKRQYALCPSQRKSMLWFVIVPTAFAAVFHLISLLSMEKYDRDELSRFGMAMDYVRVLSLFALPIAAVMAAMNYQRIRQSSRIALVGAIISFAVPILIALVPAEHLFEARIAGDQAKFGAGLVLGLSLYITLLPTILSLLPAISRACIRLKSLLPAAIAPGWGFFASAPLFMLIGFASFILIYHIASNFLLFIGVLLWIGAPLIYLTRAELLIRPITRTRDLQAIARIQIYVLATVAVGVLFIIIFLFTAKLGGKYLVGTEKLTSMMRPWDLDLHSRWIEFVGRSLFLTVVFMDLLMLMNLSIWKAGKDFYQTEAAVDYDRDMEDFSAAVTPRKRRWEEEEEDEREARGRLRREEE